MNIIMSDEKNTKKNTKEASKADTREQIQAGEAPFQILAQYVRDLSFENPNATNVLRGEQDLPEMDIAIGMDARKLADTKNRDIYEVVLNVRAEAKREDLSVFVAELQYGMTVLVGEDIPEESHHPFLLIEIPRLAFPFARQILADMTVQGGFPPLLLNPVDFHQLYMQRFGKEIQEAREEFERGLREDVKTGSDN